MTSKELREKFLNFFKQRNHAIIPSSSLIPSDPTVLFTTAGMQQFKPYYLGEKSPFGLNAATCQKCFRTSDIDEVGDERHLTFFEMLGNFSFGGYWKKEAIQSAYDFLVKELGLKIDYVSVFAGEGNIPADEESEKIWNSVDSNLEVKRFGKKDNFWGPTGEEGPCGPTTEIYINNVEIWNIVFNQYYQERSKNLKPLQIQGIDTGMGLERLAMAAQNKSNIFETDLFLPIQESKEKAQRIIADHIKAAVFLIAEGILPSNVERGYVLRRILRRAIGRYGNIVDLVPRVIEIYQDAYPELKESKNNILAVIQTEEEKFKEALVDGEKRIDKFIKDEMGKIGGKEAFDLYQSYGFPIEITIEELKNRGANFDESELRKQFEEELKKHQEVSRAGAEKKFGGHGLTESEVQNSKSEITRLHTATHLLHAALRQVLGEHVKQMGSDINAQRTRFDFKHPGKMTTEEMSKVENLVNEKIKENLAIKKEEMNFQDALKSGALAFFKEKYPEIVSVYAIDNFSKEVCAGPHVKNTSELGHFKIIKEESSSSGVRRIRAILEKE